MTQRNIRRGHDQMGIQIIPLQLQGRSRCVNRLGMFTAVTVRKREDGRKIRGVNRREAHRILRKLDRLGRSAKVVQDTRLYRVGAVATGTCGHTFSGFCHGLLVLTLAEVHQSQNELRIPSGTTEVDRFSGK